MENYSLIKRIGKGSFGEVWLIKHRQSHKQYILKQINLEHATKKEQCAAYLEAKLLSTLTHPNIVSYLDSFPSHDGCLNIIMGYCEKGDLYKLIRERKGRQFDEIQIVEWFIQICMALKYLHDLNILHRDLKTQNIFLTRSKIIKVGDLGIARVLDGTGDMATTVIGTPYYMSPELFCNKPYNHKSDVWALGCCVLEMVTLKHAFNARDLNSLMQKVLGGKLPHLPKKYNSELLDLIQSMLNNDPEKRPSVTNILENPFIHKNIKQFLEDTKHRQIQQRQSRRNVQSVIGMKSAMSWEGGFVKKPDIHYVNKFIKEEKSNILSDNYVMCVKSKNEVKSKKELNCINDTFAISRPTAEDFGNKEDIKAGKQSANFHSFSNKRETKNQNVSPKLKHHHSGEEIGSCTFIKEETHDCVASDLFNKGGDNKKICDTTYVINKDTSLDEAKVSYSLQHNNDAQINSTFISRSPCAKSRNKEYVITSPVWESTCYTNQKLSCGHEPSFCHCPDEKKIPLIVSSYSETAKIPSENSLSDENSNITHFEKPSSVSSHLPAMPSKPYKCATKDFCCDEILSHASQKVPFSQVPVNKSKPTDSQCGSERKFSYEQSEGSDDVFVNKIKGDIPIKRSFKSDMSSGKTKINYNIKGMKPKCERAQDSNIISDHKALHSLLYSEQDSPTPNHLDKDLLNNIDSLFPCSLKSPCPAPRSKRMAIKEIVEDVACKELPAENAVENFSKVTKPRPLPKLPVTPGNTDDTKTYGISDDISFSQLLRKDLDNICVENQIDTNLFHQSHDITQSLQEKGDKIAADTCSVTETLDHDQCHSIPVGDVIPCRTNSAARQRRRKKLGQEKSNVALPHGRPFSAPSSLRGKEQKVVGSSVSNHQLQSQESVSELKVNKTNAKPSFDYGKNEVNDLDELEEMSDDAEMTEFITLLNTTLNVGDFQGDGTCDPSLRKE